MADKDLKKWMRKENIYDNDLYDILSSQGITNPSEDFASYTQLQWDELWRKGMVERAKELKDQKAKLNMEKKMTKLEKYWRKQSGIKTTSIKKKKKKKTDDDDEKHQSDNSAKAQSDALTQAAGLKKYLQKNTCFMTDLVMVCAQMDINTEEDIANIDSNEAFDEIYRQVRVLRAKDLKDNESRIRMEKTMTKFQKLWRAKTGIKKSSIKKKTKKEKKKDPKTKSNEAMASGGADLKKWMRKNEIWEMELYNELMSNSISDPDQLNDVDQDLFDTIVRKVRVEKFKDLKDQKARQRVDKLLVKFEKIWRKASGVKSTSIKK